LRTLPLLLAAALSACAGARPTTAPPTLFGGVRPVVLQVPVAYDGSAELPLLVVLHGYTSSGAQQQTYFGLDSLVNTASVFLLTPDGTRDSRGNRFWNGTDACCDLEGAGVDDVAYLRGLIATVRRAYRVDPGRIFVMGHSNGAFMAYRLACEDATGVTAVVGLAGATWQDAARCAPAAGVSVLAIHGDADRTIRYDGGQITGNAYPGAALTTERWAAAGGCAAPVEAPTPLDVDAAVPGAETSVTRWTGCAAGLGVELWTVAGGGHVPALQPAFAELVWDWLAAHPRR